MRKLKFRILEAQATKIDLVVTSRRGDVGFVELSREMIGTVIHYMKLPTKIGMNENNLSRVFRKVDFLCFW